MRILAITVLDTLSRNMVLKFLAKELGVKKGIANISILNSHDVQESLANEAIAAAGGSDAFLVYTVKQKSDVLSGIPESLKSRCSGILSITLPDMSVKVLQAGQSADGFVGAWNEMLLKTATAQVKILSSR